MPKHVIYPIPFKEADAYAVGQETDFTTPVYYDGELTTCKLRLSLKQRLKVLITGTLWQQMRTSPTLRPSQRLLTRKPKLG